MILFARAARASCCERTYRDEELLRLQRDTVAATRDDRRRRPAGDPIELPPGTDALAVYDRTGPPRRRARDRRSADAIVRGRAARRDARPSASATAGCVVAVAAAASASA